MKKSLLALAVLSALAGAAAAQSSVTLSGGVDLGVRLQNGAWDMATGSSSRSAFTLSGTEDLGGGVRAFFVLNHRFRPNNGTVNTAGPTGIFYRQLWVGVSGGFGDIRLGRMEPVLQAISGNYEPWGGGTTVGHVHAGGINAGLTGAARVNNAIYYRSPSLGGLQVHADIAAADQNANTAHADGNTRPVGLGVVYAAGPLRLAAAYDRNAVDQETKGLYGAYNAGFAELMFHWENGDTGPVTNPGLADVNRWSVSAKVPIGAAVLKAGYMKWSDEDLKKFGLGVDYSLSKRTTLYTNMGKHSGNFVSGLPGGPSSTASTAAARSEEMRKARFDVGIAHRF